MKDQHTLIAGYRDLSQDEVDLMNRIKAAEEEIAEIFRMVAHNAHLDDDDAARRWAAVARTGLETGFMYLLKAVARPTNGLGRADAG